MIISFFLASPWDGAYSAKMRPSAGIGVVEDAVQSTQYRVHSAEYAVRRHAHAHTHRCARIHTYTISLSHTITLTLTEAHKCARTDIKTQTLSRGITRILRDMKHSSPSHEKMLSGHASSSLFFLHFPFVLPPLTVSHYFCVWQMRGWSLCSTLLWLWHHLLPGANSATRGASLASAKVLPKSCPLLQKAA